MFKIVIIDDSDLDANRLEQLIMDENPRFSYHIEIINSGNDKRIFQDIFDIYFLDIDIAGVDGIDLGVRIREKNHNALIIMYSQRDDLILESLNINIIQFIRKQYLDIDFHNAFKLIENKVSNLNKKIQFYSDNVLIQKAIKDIMYIEHVKNYLTIHLENEIIINVRSTISQFFRDVENCDFCLINQGLVVNFNYVLTLCDKNYSITLVNNVCLSISRRKLKEVKQAYKQYLLIRS